ncbi:hypothetical protein VMCG_08980 [Cytospora schulzeri]|uniref:CFEM domain-containing protein n=1 Tax=Cytospora schulzeri TaxID=448051 RepID=A0A423VPR0_9PEZI|nr:hypothetical protein VMCG_08980 [Valsa malicola]
MAATTLVPFASLPSCASACGPLYDVNGACVPPAAASAAASVYDACFCSDSRLSAFSSTTAGVCDSACTASPAAYNSITSWYKNLCANVGGAAAASTTTTGGSSSGKSSSSTSSSSGGGGWLSSHWQWVIFIVVMVVGIAGIWIGAAFWRRHYLRTKDRQYSLGKNLARRTGSGQNPYGGPMGGTPDRSQASMSSRPGMFMPGPAGGSNMYHEKPPKAKKKWTVTGRT